MQPCLQARLRRHRVEAAGLDLSLRPCDLLARRILKNCRSCRDTTALISKQRLVAPTGIIARIPA